MADYNSTYVYGCAPFTPDVPTPSPQVEPLRYFPQPYYSPAPVPQVIDATDDQKRAFAAYALTELLRRFDDECRGPLEGTERAPIVAMYALVNGLVREVVSGKWPPRGAK